MFTFFRKYQYKDCWKMFDNVRDISFEQHLWIIFCILSGPIALCMLMLMLSGKIALKKYIIIYVFQPLCTYGYGSNVGIFCM